MNDYLIFIISGIVLVVCTIINGMVFIADCQIHDHNVKLKREIEKLLAENKKTLELIKVEKLELAYLRS